MTKQYLAVAVLCTGLAAMHTGGDWAALGTGLFVVGLLALGDARWGKQA